ncbi:hypothetical protein [Lactococcus lactis]|nr:hypothetical protein [Lactococcus lactis]MDT2894965.1 hypothetical protein [Lactococcus lactis]
MGNPAYGAGKAAAEEAAKAALKIIVPAALGVGAVIGSILTGIIKK